MSNIICCISAFSRSDVRHSLLKMRTIDSYMSARRDRRPTKTSLSGSPPMICANRAHVPDLIPIEIEMQKSKESERLTDEL